MKKADKLTREILKDFAGDNKLYKYVVKDILADSENYNGDTLKERIMSRLEDVAHGCSSGTVSGLINYTDTTAFFKKFKKEIIALINETADAMGYSAGELLSSMNGWDNDDPFVEDVYNKNILAWFAYEETAYMLRNDLENC